MRKQIILIILFVSILVLNGCGKKELADNINTEIINIGLEQSQENAITDNTSNKSLQFNPDFIKGESMTVEVGTEISSDIRDWIICDDYENISVSIDTADSENNLSALPGLYYPISSPYKITFTNIATNESLYIEVNAIGGENLNPDTYDVTLDPYYSPITDEDIMFEAESFNEHEDYFYCTNLTVLSEQDDFLPVLAIADFANQVGKFIIPIAEAGGWEKPESCYVLASSLEKTAEYSRFRIYINPNQNLEIQVTYFDETGYEFVIVRS